MIRKYCDDANCPNFQLGAYEGPCTLGFKISLRTPKTYKDDWGFLMPKICRTKYKQGATAVIDKEPETKTEPQREGVPPKPPVKKIKPGEEKPS